MADNKRWKKLYERRKAKGECPRCGNTKDREGHYCKACAENHRAYSNETRAFLRSVGICPQCRKNSLIGEQKVCMECLAYQAEYRAKNKKPLTEERKRKTSECFKKRYWGRVEKGVCTNCGKFKPAIGKRKCVVCLEKDAMVHRLRA